MSYSGTIIGSLMLFVFAGCTSLRSSKEATTLIWSDEFNSDGLPDTSKWSYDVGGSGWGNNELQYYTSSDPENARVENGNLIIEARKEATEGKNYSSARLVTKGKGDWTYVKIDVRAKLPRGTGTWPAIWMLNSRSPLKWPEDGEIDIMEHVGYEHGKVHATVHTKKFNHNIGTQKSSTVMVPDCAEAFHVYSMIWTKDSISMLVDEKHYYTFLNDKSGKESWPFDEPFHLLLNVAVGGNWGGSKGVDEKIWPQRMEIDYVRVYDGSEK